MIGRCGYQKLPGISPCKMSWGKYWCQQKILSIISLFLSEDQLNWTELNWEKKQEVLLVPFSIYRVWRSEYALFLALYDSDYRDVLKENILIWKNIAEYDKIDLRNKRVKSAFLGNKKHFSNFLGFVCFYTCLNTISSYWNQNTYLQERT